MLKKIASALALTAALWGWNAAADDIEILLDKDLGNKVLNEIQFPVEEVIASSALSPFSAVGASEADIVVDEGDVTGLESDATLSRFVEDQILEELTNPSDAFATTNPSDATVKFFTTLRENLDIDTSEATQQQLRAAVRAALAKKKELQTLLAAAIRGWFKFEVVWVKLRIYDRPNAVIANPIEIRGLNLGVQAKVEACIKLLGKWRCTDATSPMVRLSAKSALLTLSAVPPTVKGQPSFQDLDIVIKITIFGKTFTIRIGVTKIVNHHLRKAGPITIVDLSSFQAPIPRTGKVLKIDRIVIESRPAGLAIKATTVAVPAS